MLLSHLVNSLLVCFREDHSFSFLAILVGILRLLFGVNRTISGNMENKKVVLLAVGSFNPPTNGHLRMLEDAKYSLEKTGVKVLEGIMSPVSDGYGKATLINSSHRLAMTQKSVQDSDWIHADGWECSKPEWTTTVSVLKHHQNDVKKRLGEDVDVLLVVGGDVVETFDMFNADGTPVWEMDDIAEILSAGLVVQPRPGSNPLSHIKKLDIGKKSDNVHLITNEIFGNPISSTSLRTAIKMKRSIKYTTPDAVIKYINDNKLYE